MCLTNYIESITVISHSIRSTSRT